MNKLKMFLGLVLFLSPILPARAADTLIPFGATWKFLDNGTDQGTAWRELAFDDSAWASGPAELGYGDTPRDEATIVSFGGNSANKHVTTYFRRAFTAPNVATYTQLRLRLKRDDGGVVYLNGTEIFRSANMQGNPIAFNTLASFTGENDIDSSNVSVSLPLLNAGANVIAVEIHQQARDSSDISFDFELIGSENNAPTISIVSPLDGARFTAPANLLVRASAADPDGNLTLVEFFSGTTKLGEGTTFQTNSVPVGSYAFHAIATDALGLRATSSVVNIFVDPSTVPVVFAQTPAPGNVSSLSQITVTFSERVTGVKASDLLVNGLPALNVSGTGSNYTFTIAPPADGLVLVSWDGGRAIQDFESPARAFDSFSAGASWQYTLADSSVPAAAQITPVPGAAVRSLDRITVQFTEPVTGVDAADLRINGASAITLTGHGAGPYEFTFTQPAAGTGTSGGTVTLAWAAGADIRDLSSARNLFPGGSWSYTLNTNANFDGAVVINEIMYHPSTERDDQEWIELFNRSTNAVNLAGWQLSRGANFTLPATTLAAGAYLVLAADTNAFRTLHPNVANVIGGWTGRLSNTGEEIELEDANGARVDRVTYADQGDWATRTLTALGWDWSSPADGFGSSLELRQAALPNDNGQNWAPSTALNGTPGAANSTATANLPPLVLEVTHFPAVPNSTSAVTILARVVDESSGTVTVRLWRRDITSGALPAFTSVTMLDNGLSNDGAAGDGIYGGVLAPQVHGTIIEYYVEAVDGSSNARTWPATVDTGGGALAQDANAFFQVDNESYTGRQAMYRMVMRPADLTALLGSAGNQVTGRTTRNATFITIEGGDVQIRHNCITRRRGASSFNRNPPTLKFEIPSDRPWNNKTSFNLNSDHTYAQVLGSAIVRKAGLPTPYAYGVQLRFNGVNQAQSGDSMFGSYAHIEGADADFARDHFPDDADGNVYSKRRPECDLEYRGTNPVAYINCAYDKESNASVNDWSDLANLFFALDPEFTPDEQYVQAVRRNVNVELWMRYFVLHYLLDYSETALSNGVDDDYDMYRGILDPRFIIVPHDFDSIFGSSGASHGTDIFRAGLITNVNRFLRHAEFEPLYYAEYRHQLDGLFNTNSLFPLIDQMLGDWVPAGTIASMKNVAVNRMNLALALIPPAPVVVSATIEGVPATPTFLNTATIQIGGTDITHYRYRINGGAFGSETPVGTPIELSGLADGSYTVFVIGRNASGLWQSENSPTRSRTWTVLSGLRRVVINEVLARNTTAAQVNGAFPDLIELHNPRATTVDLSGLRLTDDLNVPNRFVFPSGTTIAGGGHLTLIAANAGGSPGLHLGFSLDQNGETLHLLDTAANGGGVLDTVTFGLQLPDLSVGRTAGGHWSLCVPTIGAVNVPAPTGDPSALRINEWLTSGLPPMSDDFIELYNPGALPVAIGGLYFTDLPYGQPFQHRLTPLSFLPGFGYKAFLADGQPGLGADHLGLKLESSIGEIGLVRADGSVVDSVVYGLQQDGISQGRVPNGGSQIKYLTPPTPGAPNPVPPTPIPPLTINLLPLDANVLWRYNDTGADLGTSWSARTFNDSGWPNGPALLALDPNLNPPEPIRTPLTLASNRITFYFRTHFTVPANLNISQLQATHAIDDGAVFHINGVEAGRFNMPSGGINFSTQATTTHEATALETISLSLSSLVPGDNVIAVEVHQNGVNSSDLVFGMRLDAVILTNSPSSAGIVLNEILANNQSVTNADGSVTDWVELRNPSNSDVDLAGMSLTDQVSDPRRWVFPQGSVVSANGFLLVRFDASLPASTNVSTALNTGFGLNASGDEIYLFNQSATGGELLDAVLFGVQASDLSIGRAPVGGTNWIATLPTPATANLVAVLGDPALLKFNEWMANPSSGDDWIELFNSNPQPVALAGLSLTDDLNNRAKNPLPPLSFIGAGAQGFLRFEADNNPDAGANHLNFKLSGDGESLGLFTAVGTLIDSVTFGAQAEGVSQGRLPDGSANILSFPGHATPGDANFLTLSDVVINEVLAHSTLPLEDAIELHNTGAGAIDISGWYLSDSQNNPLKFAIPANTILPAGGFAVFYENQFNQLNPDKPFSLSSANGDDVFLSQVNGPGQLTGYRATTRFGASAQGVSVGRHYSSVGVDFTALSQRTFGEDSSTTVEGFRTGTGLPNSAPLVGPVVISEIMYHPPDVILAGVTNDNDLDEFIELRNLSAEPVALFDASHPTNVWRLRDAVDFEFPASTTLPGDGRLVIVSFDPLTNAAALAAFRLKHSLDGSAVILGPWRGRLANNSENVELFRPDAPVAPGLPDAGFVPYLLVDRVRYSDTLPWPSLADGNTNGNGLSLHRRVAAAYGNDPVNWIAAVPTPGAGNAPAVIIPPGIASFSLSQVVASGASVTLNVTATGGGVLAYEWRRNGVLIPGANGALLVLTNFQAASAGRYSVLVANGAGAASAFAVLELGAPPSFVRPPSNQLAEPGATASFSVIASGTAPLTYQWLRAAAGGFEPLAGANGPVLSLLNVQLADAVAYRVIVANAFGSATSAPASLTVVSPPVIATHPVGTNVLVGQGANFSVAVLGSAPFAYQWRLNGANLPGATNATLVLLNLQVASSGNYSVRVTNLIGSVISSNAVLLVEPPPSASVTATDVVAAEPGADAASLTFTRTRVTDQPQQIFFTVSGSAVPGSDYIALTSPVTIPAGSSSVTIALTALDDSLAESNEFVFITIVAGPDYVPGASPLAVVVITDNDNLLPVVNVTAPANGLVVNAPANVLVTATATDPDGSVTRVEFYANGTNRLGEDLTAPYAFTWTNAPLGSNFISVVAVDNLGGLSGVAVLLIVNNLPTVALTAPSDGAIFNPGSDITLAANAADTDGTIATVEFFAGGLFLGSDSTSPYRFTWAAVPEGVHSLRAQAIDNRGAVRASVPVTITVGIPTPLFGDAFTGRGVIVGFTNTALGTNLTFTREAGEPRHASRSGNHSGWLTWTAPASGLCRIDTFGSDFDTLLAVYTGGSVSNLTIVTANDDANSDSILSSVAFNVTNGVTYQIAVDGYGTNTTTVGGNVGHIVLNLALANPYPVILTQPRSLVVTQGNTATFTVTTHSPPPTNQTFRWRFNGNNIAGATNLTLTLNNVQAASAGNYTFVANNSSGSATSVVAVLVVLTSPIITSQPQGSTVPGGGSAFFSVTATGLLPINYQWRYNGSDIPGATSNTLVLLNVQGRQEGLYSVTLSNPLGITDSTSVQLIVDDGLRVSQVDLLFSQDHPWRYNASGLNLGNAWRFPGYDDSGWSNGVALFGLESANVYPWPILTSLPLNGILTYYFRTSFPLPDASAYTSIAALAYLDDGAVWYVNGREAARVRLSAGIPPDGMTSTALASGAPEGDTTVVFMPLTNAISGSNLLSVEVHQQTAGSSDVVFGMELYGIISITNGPVLLPPAASVVGTEVTLNGISGRDYSLELSTNLVQWSTVASWTNFTGSALYLDPVLPSSATGNRFYRGRLVR